MDGPLRLLVIADVHYATCLMDAAGPVRRQCLRGRELLSAALDDAGRRGGFDVLVLLGDMLNNGDSPRAGSALADLRAELDRRAGNVPRLVVPGNHDGPAERALTVLGGQAGLHEIGGYRFVVFADAYDGDLAARGPAGRDLLIRLARPGGGLLVVCQHNPMDPVIEEDYPYMLTDRPDVMQDYAEAGVLLSLSGHYHPGQPLHQTEGVWYFTAPALCEPPFPYSRVVLDSRRVAVEQVRLGDFLQASPSGGR